jgi:hypothetical protein
MINCKTASNDTCGKGKKCCCFFCEEKEACNQCCPDVQDGTVKDPMEDCNDAYDFQPPKTLEEAIPEILDDITKVALVIKKQEAKQDEFKEKILQVMEANGIKKWENEFISITYVAPTTRTSIDSTALKKKYPQIAEECSKNSDVKSSIRIKVKE